ncbi:hypothetical protein P4N68_08515 [Corynebacterium felinum]|uniref:Uncharacterized protein n=1 Tax=Corynebacterium felinum TaxID=131318 RepID=A0ABU2B8P6_9CORY|nr:hypothetical protein [Corynebacterium felinum]MDF5821119.1 hypothetical protein [Corynebacterium felinum]MDR7354987.1 hypothetical protein [Corynebacterium felinum]WJY94343.1 hypothetical protein CFELI_03515 [Corynebacterium felinum]
MRSQQTCVGVDTRKTSFHKNAVKKRLWLLSALISAAGLGFAPLLTYKNPMPLGTEQFSADCVSMPSRCHRTVTGCDLPCSGDSSFSNGGQQPHHPPPPIKGFESLYRVIHTATVFVFGTAGLITTDNLGMFVLQLVGIVIGGGRLGSNAAFMQRMLTPSDLMCCLRGYSAQPSTLTPAIFRSLHI